MSKTEEPRRMSGAPGAPRLRRSREFSALISGGRRRTGRRLVVYVLAGVGPARAGFVCGRGVGGAVARNRARRILKEAWRSMSPSVTPGTLAVFVARPEIVGAKTQDLILEMRQLLAGEVPP
jgi:ribonuclease P protein component